jgi:hypothetical protein
LSYLRCSGTNIFPRILVGEEKGCARTIAFKLGWSSPPDERLGFGGGSANSPFEVDWQGFEVGFMMEDVIFYIKRKRI